MLTVLVMYDRHFYFIDIFAPIVPKIIGFPEFWVYLSGVFEIALGLGSFTKTRYFLHFSLSQCFLFFIQPAICG